MEKHVNKNHSSSKNGGNAYATLPMYITETISNQTIHSYINGG